MEPLDVKDLEELFQDRFTEKDATYSQIKSKKCPPPPAIYPWKIASKAVNKRWDYSSGRQNRWQSRYDRDRSNSQHSYRDRSIDDKQRGRYEGQGNSSSHYEDDRNDHRSRYQDDRNNHRSRYQDDRNDHRNHYQGDRNDHRSRSNDRNHSY